ncbi:MAG: PD-(D/E)XK nuclease family protein [Candidatus Marsarchaeota archaeon]|nr:PD-(D/E)XK nuclease family protein [Candidatus Marsarchaeota archaeon]
MKSYKISPSTLSLLEDCPRCFWLQIVKGIKRPDAPFPSLPSGIDSVLKKHFDAYRKLGKLPPELKKHRINARLFDDMDLLEVWRANFKGIRWTDKKSSITLRGAVDEILEKNGTLIVLDFKTRGFPLKEDTAEHYRDQIDIYNYLLRKNGFKTANYGYLLFFHPAKINGNSSFLFNTDIVTMKINVNHAEKLFKNAIKVLTGRMPKASKTCKFCAWRVASA